MKIIGISDLHGDLIYNINPCDVLCICGDIVPLKMQRNIPQSIKWLKKDFQKWVNELPCKKVILVGGNHDFCLDGINPELIKEIFNDKVIYLDNSTYVYEGISFYGNPTCTGPVGWAFYKPDQEGLFNIPDNIDIVLVHQPPYGEVGTVLQQYSYNHLANYGSINLRNEVIRKNPKYLLCGHIHSGQHSVEMIGETQCYNVSIKDENYDINFYPTELNI